MHVLCLTAFFSVRQKHIKTYGKKLIENQYLEAVISMPSGSI